MCSHAVWQRPWWGNMESRLDRTGDFFADRYPLTSINRSRKQGVAINETNTTFHEKDDMIILQRRATDIVLRTVIDFPGIHPNSWVCHYVTNWRTLRMVVPWSFSYRRLRVARGEVTKVQ